MGGGAMHWHIEFPMTQLSTSSSNHPSLSSSTSSNRNNSFNPANCTAPLKQPSSTAYCSCQSNTCKRLQSVGGKEDKRGSGSIGNTAFGSVPSNLEVENAVAALQNFMLGISSTGPELKWLQPLLGSGNPRTLSSEGYRRVYDTFRLLLTDPSMKRLVVSLSSDQAVWHAITNNELVRKLIDSPYPVENRRHDCSDEEPNLAADILRWILGITKAKVMELIEKFLVLMNEVFYSFDKEKTTVETRGNLEDTVRSSLLLSLVILFIVIVARIQGA